MTVTCPHCESRYLLSPSLMGPGGARVRCPRCRLAFLVAASGEVTALPDDASEQPQAPAGKTPAPAPTPESETPAGVARRLLAEMDAEHGPSEVAFAAEQGTILLAHGPRLMEAFDEYKRIVGRGASVAVFREALRERWGVELTPAEPLPR